MSGKIMELIINAGLRKNFRMSLSTIAKMRCSFISFDVFPYLYRWLTSRRMVSEAASRSWRPV
jgi:hypothetical protein